MDKTQSSTIKIDNACVVLIKWDALDFGMQHGIDVLDILGDWLSSRDLYILAKHDIGGLSGKQIDEIYWDKHKKPYYQALRESLVGTASVALLIGGVGDVPERMKDIKGHPDMEGSIRWEWSFKRYFEKSEDYKDWQDKRGKYEDTVLWQHIYHKIYRDDRLHSTINQKETIMACSVLFPRATIEGVLSRYPELAKNVRLH